MSIVREALIEEITQKAELSQDYYNTLCTAKTEAKRRVYKKKLKIHNNILADLLIALDKLDNKAYNSNDINKTGNNADVHHEPTEQN